MAFVVETPVQDPVQQQQTAQHLFQIATGYIASTAMQIAIELRVADRLADGPRSAADLARECGVQEDPLYRVLRALASTGVFEEIAPRQFALNDAARMLRSDAPGSLFEMVRWISDPFHMRVYADAMHSMHTGAPAAEKTVGMPVFEYFAHQPALSEVFNDAMTAFNRMVVPAVLEAYDFSGVQTLVDVAGGHGSVLTGVLERYPHMRGILCDVDHVIAGARARLQTLDVADRVTTAIVDMFAEVPAGGDAYLMKHIIHDWYDDRAGLILRNIRRVLPAHGRVILLEYVIPAGNGPDFGKMLDLEMLLMPGGKERTEDEFRALFAANGFELTRIVPTASQMSVIEARPR